jgi:nicotinate phosphoribosyltransferase
MALISELYFEIITDKKRESGELDIYSDKNQKNDQNKAELMVKHNAYYADFGSRRRFSFNNHERVVKNMVKHGSHCFVGTSNVYLAMENNLKPIGTMAHEWIMAIAAIYGYKMSNDVAFRFWTETYGGDLGIALTDTFTTTVFFDSFDMKLSKLFDGMRHDSGNPYDFADKCIAHYKSLGIDPMSKVLVFSDGLTVTDAVKIKEYCVGKIKCSFGIGTHFTNDVGETSLNIVIKISEAFVKGHWIPAVKLSDNVGKNTGDPREVQLCKDLLRIE